MLPAKEPLFVLHIELPDLRIAEILFVALQILLAHLIGIDEVDRRVFHMDVVFKMGKKIGIILVPDGFGLEF